MKNTALTLVPVLAPVLLSGCASIFNGSSNVVAISSNAPDANYTIVNREGQTVRTGTLPASVTLNGGAGYFKAESYTIALKKEGYEDTTAQLDPHLSGWYFGNLVLGGLVGMLIVDPITGAMYRVPDETSVPMRKLEGYIATSTPQRTAASYTSANNQAALPQDVRWLYQAEKLAVQMNCSSTAYSSKGPGVEFFEAACSNGPVSIRCDFGQCVALK